MMKNGTVFEMLEAPLRRFADELGLKEPTLPQTKAIPHIIAGENVLIIAPTGSGKTEAALLPVVNELLKTDSRQGISILYITPLRALNRDMLKRLQIWSARLGFSVEIRHGDTPQHERRRQSARPPDMLVTTPETLQAILPGGRMRRHLQSVRWVVVDEIHELAEDKRGVQLTVGLERLTEAVGHDFQRIGLSATVGSPVEVAKFLVGPHRLASILQAKPSKRFEYFVECIKPQTRDYELSRKLNLSPEAVARLNRMSHLVDEHESTLVFVNSRTNAELLGSRLNMLRNDIAVHHSSLPREERTSVENRFKNGELKALVCTSTLELGIDIGHIDFVLQFMSPRQVSALVQRIGRSGHTLEKLSEGVIITVSADDAMEAIACAQKAYDNWLEPTSIHAAALDVLAHQVAGLLMDSKDDVEKNHILNVLKRAYPYASLEIGDFHRVVEFMEDLNLLRVDGAKLLRRRNTRTYYYENLSMIPDERRYLVVDVTTMQRVGILGEEFMVTKARKGLHFIVKGRVWEIESIQPDGYVYVRSVEDPTAAIPGWAGELLPLSAELAQHVGRLRRYVERLVKKTSRTRTLDKLSSLWPANAHATEIVVSEIADQIEAGIPVPSDKQIVIEAYDRYLIIHSCFGDRVNNTLGRLFEELLTRRNLVRLWWHDAYRILFELTVDTAELDLEEIRKALFETDEDLINEAFNSAIFRHFPFVTQLKEVAERFGALRRGAFLFEEKVRELHLRFRLTPVFDETLRQAKQERIDLETATRILKAVKLGKLRVAIAKPHDHPSPIAYPILYRHAEAPELMAPETVAMSNLERMRLTIENERIDLLCFDCGHLHMEMKVSLLPEKPRCENCSSSLLAPVSWGSPYLKTILEKRRAKEKLQEDEEELLSRARRSADLVLSYGRKGVIAQSVYGIGPHTAFRILAKMHSDERGFYQDLMEAKLQFIATRRFWDRPPRT